MTSVEVKRKRVVIAKPTKGGCLTCRQRKVKCDQERPSCRKCAVKDRLCTWPEVKTPCTKTQLILPDLKSFARTLQVPRVLTLGLQMLSHESQALQYFGTELIPPMLRYSPYVKLAMIAFQSCSLEPTVLQSMVAMVQSHRSRVHGHDTTLMTIKPRQAVMTAQEEHNKALRALCLHINESLVHRKSTLPVLMASLMLIMFDLFQGAPGSAYKHIINMKHILQGTDDAACTREELDAINELRYSLVNIDLGRDSATALSETNHALFAGLEGLLDDGSQLRRHLIERGEAPVLAQCEPMASGLLHCIAICVGRTICLEHDRGAQLRLQRLMIEHGRWDSRFEESCTRLPVPLQHYAKVQYLYSRLSIEGLDARTTPDSSQTEDRLVTLLAAAEQYLRTFTGFMQPIPRNHFAWSDPSPTISISLNIVKAIYFVALRSGSATTRRAAVDLLYAANRRESTFPSALLGAFATAVDEIYRADYADGLPDEIVNAHEHGKGEIFDLTCVRIVREQSGKPIELEIREYHCRDDVEDAPLEDSQVPWSLSRAWTIHLSDFA